ncbi:MAG TPA: TerB family tellurite resistance protein [Candidatus Acidoferrum sp.]|nr:TerB family tellurite resistance protein [Candidatus Acidoferrum sp.]
MLQSIASFFEQCLHEFADTAQDTQQRLQLACAALLIEVSVIDEHQSEEEIATLSRLLRQRFGLDDAALAKLWQLARDEVKNATSLYQFTALVNEGFGYEQKCELLRQLWEVAYADGRIDRYEEHLIRRIADLLNLSHGDFIRAKLATKPAD